MKKLIFLFLILFNTLILNSQSLFPKNFNSLFVAGDKVENEKFVINYQYLDRLGFKEFKKENATHVVFQNVSKNEFIEIKYKEDLKGYQISIDYILSSKTSFDHFFKKISSSQYSYNPKTATFTSKEDTGYTKLSITSNSKYSFQNQNYYKISWSKNEIKYDKYGISKMISIDRFTLDQSFPFQNSVWNFEYETNGTENTLILSQSENLPYTIQFIDDENAIIDFKNIKCKQTLKMKYSTESFGGLDFDMEYEKLKKACPTYFEEIYKLLIERSFGQIELKDTKNMRMTKNKNEFDIVPAKE